MVNAEAGRTPLHKEGQPRRTNNINATSSIRRGVGWSYKPKRFGCLTSFGRADGCKVAFHLLDRRDRPLLMEENSPSLSDSASPTEP
jgi:hypothetical protein